MRHIPVCLSTRRALLLGAACFASLNVAACGVSSLSGSVAGNPAAATVTFVTTATANEPVPTLPAAARPLMRQAIETDDGRAVLVVAGQPVPTVIDLEPRRSNGEIEFGQRRQELTDLRFDVLDHALRAQHSGGGPVDMLQALVDGARAADKGPIVMETDGLSTSGGLDQRQVKWNLTPQQVAGDLRARALLPDLHGRPVLFVGLGNVAGPQAPLPTPLRTWLIGTWTAICHAAGASSCSVDNTLPSTEVPASAAASPVVPVPRVHSVTGADGSVLTSIPADLLGFRFDSAQLGPDASAVLLPLVQRAVQENRQVDLTGHADPRGSLTYNTSLSKARARSTADLMTKLGLPVRLLDQVDGVGTAGDPPDAGYTNGQIDEAKCAQLRRVDITLLPSSTK